MSTAPAHKGRGPSGSHAFKMKDTATTLALAAAATGLGAIAWPEHPALAWTAWGITAASVLTLAAAHIIARKARR